MVSWAHVHIAINHLPVIGIIPLIALLALAMWEKEPRAGAGPPGASAHHHRCPHNRELLAQPTNSHIPAAELEQLRG